MTDFFSILFCFPWIVPKCFQKTQHSACCQVAVTTIAFATSLTEGVHGGMKGPCLISTYFRIGVQTISSFVSVVETGFVQHTFTSILFNCRAHALTFRKANKARKKPMELADPHSLEQLRISHCVDKAWHDLLRPFSTAFLELNSCGAATLRFWAGGCTTVPTSAVISFWPWQKKLWGQISRSCQTLCFWHKKWYETLAI